jgi:hypothetical protein
MESLEEGKKLKERELLPTPSKEMGIPTIIHNLTSVVSADDINRLVAHKHPYHARGIVETIAGPECRSPCCFRGRAAGYLA